MLFSILVPIYNVEKYLGECLDSLLAQTCCDFEIILVDDGSPDASGKICDEYAFRHTECIRVKHKENQGNLAARLDAIRLAQGDFCIFVDSDDFVEPTLLEEVSGVFRNAPDTDVVLYSFRYHRNGKLAERFHPIAANGRVWIENEKRELYEKLLFTNDVSPIWTKAVKTSLLKSDPTDYSVYYGKNMAEDVLQSLYILTAAQKVSYLNRPLYNYRIVANSVSHTFSAENLSRKCCLHVYEKELEYLKIWGMDTPEFRGRVAAAWFGRAMYEFIHCYENASSAKERKAIVDANWGEVFPSDAHAEMRPFLSPAYIWLYENLNGRNYRALHFFFLKRKICKFWKSLKNMRKFSEGEHDIVLMIKVMNGGGAERVISLLANYLLRQNWDVTLLLTHQKLKDADLTRLNKGIRVISLEDEVPLQKSPSRFRMLYARMLGRLLRLFNAPEDRALVEKYAARNSAKIHWLKHFFKEHRKATAIAFLYDSIFLALLAKGKDNRLIISERGDPGQSLESKTDMAFFRIMFPKANAMVFQSPDVLKWYKEKIGIEGNLIFNPITEGLPTAWHGERKKRIVNFCRINPQKNLMLLIDAFELFHKDFPEYELWIYGNVSKGDEGYYQLVNTHVQNCISKDRIRLEPARKNIHSLVLDAAMFVSSSDFEGMSNSMLEAMAIGLPVVCTDCPAGGARAVITDHENGLLVPIKDKQKLYLAMREIIDNSGLAEKLSRNAAKIRETQSEKVILNKWLNLVNARDTK